MEVTCYLPHHPPRSLDLSEEEQGRDVCARGVPAQEDRPARQVQHAGVVLQVEQAALDVTHLS